MYFMFRENNMCMTEYVLIKLFSILKASLICCFFATKYGVTCMKKQAYLLPS